MLLMYMAQISRGSAQVHTASLTGLVTDPVGAVVANAAVSVKNTATNLEHRTVSDASGYYTFASLPVGSYVVTAEV